jgi:hypothetical protein
MSAFLVSPETVSVILTQLQLRDAAPLVNPLRAFTAPLDPRDALDDLGRQLLRLNVDALVDRYPTTPHVEEERRAAAYTFTARLETAGYALRQLDCYLYQIGEGDVSERPLAVALGKVRRILADRVLDDVPSYAAAPWGIQG